MSFFCFIQLKERCNGLQWLLIIQCHVQHSYCQFFIAAKDRKTIFFSSHDVSKPDSGSYLSEVRNFCSCSPVVLSLVRCSGFHLSSYWSDDKCHHIVKEACKSTWPHRYFDDVMKKNHSNNSIYWVLLFYWMILAKQVIHCGYKVLVVHYTKKIYIFYYTRIQWSQLQG